jgi:two-component system response regulator VanR
MNNAVSSLLSLAPRQRWLVVDDQADLSELIADVLAGLDLASVENFTASGDALAAITTRAGGFDLVVTDRDMPGLNGLDLARKVRSHSPAAKVILVSAGVADLAPATLAAAGVDAVLSKPFNLASLESTVRALAMTPSPRTPPALAKAA